MEREVRRLCIENRVVVAAAQFKRDFACDWLGDPTLRGLPQHHCLRVEPAALVQQAAELAAILAVLLDRVLIVNAGDEALIGNEEQSESGSFVDAAALGLDDAILNLVRHAEAVSSSDAICFQKQLNRVVILAAIECDWKTLFEAHRNLFALDF